MNATGTGVAAALIGVAVLGAVSPASAQGASDTQAARLDLARRIVAVNGGADQFAATVKTMYRAINANLAATLPPGQAEAAQLIQTDLESELIGLTPRLVDIGVRAYADNLTQPELASLLAWEQSPAARAIHAKGPAILAEVLTQEMPLITAAMPGIMQRAVDHACAAARCTPKDRQTLTAAVAQALAKQAS